MSQHEDEQRIHNEPHLHPDHKRADPSEARAARTLRRESPQEEATYRDGRSVYDEPDVFPDRPQEIVDQDWSCSQCGYNLRGLPAHHPCPECGHRELYRPPPAGSKSFRAWFEARAANVTLTQAWTVAIAAAFGGGLVGVVSALFGTDPLAIPGKGLLLIVVVFAPAIEETMKIAIAAYVVEVRPYLFQRVEQLQVATIGAALLFASIENVMYINIMASNPSVEYMLYRWIACTSLHVGCTLVAARGLAEVWRRAVTEYRPPQFTLGLRWLVIAITIHGCYNAGAATFAWLV